MNNWIVVCRKKFFNSIDSYSIRNGTIFIHLKQDLKSTLKLSGWADSGSKPTSTGLSFPQNTNPFGTSPSNPPLGQMFTGTFGIKKILDVN